MEKSKKKNNIFKISLIIGGCLLFLFLLKSIGVFNFLYFNKLKNINDKNTAIYKLFINNKIKVTKIISEDAIIQSSLFQSKDSSLMDSFKHLTLYKRSFTDIRSITLFDFLYKIVLTSEVEEYIINQNLNKDWFLNALSKGYFISDISYDYKYNEFIIAVIYPINNIVDENVGYIMIDYSLSELFAKFSEFKDIAVLLKKQDKYIFTFPLTYKIDNEKDFNNMFSSWISENIDGEYIFITAASKGFFKLPMLLKIILILFLTTVLLLLGSLGLEKYSQNIEDRNLKFQKMASDIVKMSKNITIKNIKEKNEKNDMHKVDQNFLKNNKTSSNTKKEGKEADAQQDDFHFSK